MTYSAELATRIAMILIELDNETSYVDFSAMVHQSLVEAEEGILDGDTTFQLDNEAISCALRLRESLDAFIVLQRVK
jgi:hypothetical protein